MTPTELADMPRDGRATPKPQTVGEKIADSLQFTFVVRDDAKVVIAIAIDKAAADECEACTRVAEADLAVHAAKRIAAAIRARANP